MDDWIDLDTPHGRIHAWHAAPPEGTAANGGLVLVQEIFGVNEHIRDVAGRLAAEGFDVLAPCVFDLVAPGMELDYDEAGIGRGRELAAAVGFDRAVDLVDAAAGWLRRKHGTAAAMGFCWGGTVALLANTRLGLPAVSYYGGRTMQFLDEPLRAPMLMHFGERDPIIPPADVEAQRRSFPDAEIHVYPAGHGFNCDHRADFDADSAALAWRRTIAFLRAAMP